ncbi:pilus assembly protein [Janibacter melonis]|uniref:TadE family protein n=1 Tax=Janibacter melonis TaxID=262209 RepID=UPI002043DC6A|nr:TadE family protein [Janibacter melonis]MCM3555913.1 pilus assembly protein [Janibacter melonis]
MEWAIIAPVAILVVFGIIQTAFWFTARTEAQGAAAAGARSGSVQGASPETAEAAARDYLGQVGSGDSQVRADRSGTAVTVTVTRQVNRVLPLPGVPSHVEQSATAEVERWTQP